MGNFGKIFVLLVAISIVVGFSAQAQATLILRGEDSWGNQLIYDKDLDITWYDSSFGYQGWQMAMDQAAVWTVDFGGVVYDDWRLPSALNQDGSGPCSGFNCTDSELGHLYYVELGNEAGGPLKNTGPFTDYWFTRGHDYWTGNEYALDPDRAWAFRFFDGVAGDIRKGYGALDGPNVILVRSGDVSHSSSVPVPGTMLLVGSGLPGLILFRKRFRSKVPKTSFKGA